MTMALGVLLASPVAAAAVESPQIVSLSPATAVAGSVVTVLGSGLDPSFVTVAAVNGVAAEVVGGTDTALQITVPTAAGSGLISVTNSEGTAVADTDLFIAPSGVTADQVTVAQRTTVGAAVPVALPAAGQVGLLTVPAVAGDRIAVDVTGSTFGNSTSYAQVSVIAPDGSLVVAPTGFASAGVFIEPVVATLDGTYTVLIDPQGTRTGSASVTVYDVPADVVVPAVAGGEAVSVATSTAGQNASVVFAGTAGQRVSVTLSDSTFGTSSTSVQVLDPEGSVVTSTSFTSTSTYIDTLTLPADGDYTIALNPSRAITGTVDVQVADASSAVIAGAADGSNITVTTSTPGQDGEVSFDAAAGDRIAVRTSWTTFGSTSATMVRLSLVSPSGVTVIPLTAQGSNYFIEPVTLPETGTYRLVVNPPGSQTGSVGLNLYTVPADPVVPTTTSGDPVTLTTATAGQNASVVFAGTAGQRISLTFTGSTFGTSSNAVKILRPDGTILSSATLKTTSLYLGVFTLPSDGDYTVVVDPYRNVTGHVTIKVFDVPPNPTYEYTVDDAPLAIEAAAPGQYLTITTQLTAGQTYGFADYGAPGTRSVVIWSDAGTLALSKTFTTTNASATFTAATTGTYTVTVSPQTPVYGAWHMTIFDRVAAPLVTLPPTETAWHTQDTFPVSWIASSTGETITGYAIAQDSSPTTEPTDLTTTTTSATMTFPEGDSWLHVRAVLADGTLGPVTHQQIHVDTQAPTLGALSSPTHPDPTSGYGEANVSLTWDAAEDATGIAGYSVDASQSFSGQPDAVVETDETTYTFSIPSTGLWYLRVRPIDLAGNVGAAQTYEVNVDVGAPAAPTVTASHQDGIASSQQTLVADFTSGDGDPVASWSAVVDQSPDTVPDPANGHAEPRLVQTLTPGTWWLHVIAGDTLGRWSSPTHLQVIVTEAGVVIMQPAQSWVWAETSINVACADGPDGLSLATIYSDGTTSIVGPLTADGSTCNATWDPTLTAGGDRIWPDGDYNLTVVDDTGEEVSDRVPVTVAVDSSAIDRLIADYRAGVINATQLVDLIVGGLDGDDSVPNHYASDASDGSITIEQLMQALALLDEEARQAALEALAGSTDAATQEPAPPLTRDSTDSSTSGLLTSMATSSTDTEPTCTTGVVTRTEHCWIQLDEFLITYRPTSVGVSDGYEGIPPLVQATYDALVYAKTTYQGMGFATTSEVVKVELVSGGLLKPGVGMTTSGSDNRTIQMNVSNMTSDPTTVYYLASHEYFHMVQYQYFNILDLLWSSPYWWMEATAEWAAHQVQEQPFYPGQRSPRYASQIGTFLSSSGQLAQANTSVLVPDGPEYGAFLLAEYLDEAFGGAEAIRWTWQRIGYHGLGVSPLNAIDDYVQSQGETYSESIEQFRLWNYILSDDGNYPDTAEAERIGYTDPDAKAGGRWRDRLTQVTGDGEEYRRITSAAGIDPETDDASGAATAAASNTAYLEIAVPAGVGGNVTLTVTRDASEDIFSDLDDTRASVIPVADYPQLCGDVQPLHRTAVDSPATGTTVDALQITFEVPAACDTVTLAITNTDKSGPPDHFNWTATVETTGYGLSNGTIDLGIGLNGAPIGSGVGLRLANDPDSEVLVQGCLCTSWGVADGTQSGWVNTTAGDYTQGALTHVDSDATATRVDVKSNLDDTLDIDLNYHASDSTYLYAVDVSVTRTATTATSGTVLFDYALDFDVPPFTFYESAVWEAQDSQPPSYVSIASRDGFHTGNPLTDPANVGTPIVWGETFGPYDQGAMVRLDLGDLDVGEMARFTIYVGVAPDEATAEAALETVPHSLSAQFNTDAEVALFAVGAPTHIPAIQNPPQVLP
ncbi:hypothetical protein RN607_11245 [Demequina capsici]|uniref:IPT/TIG domain-containing protein n=1 Tax=Demequina capsici TaxID=3075620 RepID=A0AA96F9P8_9MICO|nr:hypothetical protein [Demequina sp. PMTSA13]WNM26766.1 hypothetical protein RN607_11245 [Demequina sp. PMTSA13]